MQWRNEQIYHLRQAEPLTKERQDWYFDNVVAKLFDQDRPDQILFSFLHNEECIGYGGLVHINWVDRNAELSFVMKTDLQDQYFVKFWIQYLNLIKKPSFKELNLRKIFTYAFDIRERLYPALEGAGFTLDACLSDHCHVDGEFRDVLIHSFWNPAMKLVMREANEKDVDLYFDWANDDVVRQNSLDQNPIIYENHVKWFMSKLSSDHSLLYIFEVLGRRVGQVRLDKVEDAWEIDYSVDSCYRGLGVGKMMITQIMQKNFHTNLNLPLKALVKSQNLASQRVFEQLGFQKIDEVDETFSYMF
jgi:RimJ/RimL family protein N-acetyltransferase